VTEPKPKPEHPAQAPLPSNLIRRPLRLSQMPKIKVNRCTCRKPVPYHRSDGRVTCVPCKGEIEGAAE
jgi:hypothetical protein